MNEISGIVRVQLDALLELVEEARANRCGQFEAEARASATDLRRRARRQARERVSEAARQERERLERELRLERAALETERRSLERRRESALLAAGRQVLTGAIAERWGVPEARCEWALAAIDEAAEVLIGRDWTVEHPEDWPAVEREWLTALARARHRARVECRPDPTIGAGLRIVRGGASVDMTAGGLAARTRRLDADLLAELCGEEGS